MTAPLDERDPKLDHLASLHPTYSQLELREAQAQLRQYFDLAWEIFSRITEQNEPSEINLTVADLNPMVNPPTGTFPSIQDRE